VIALSKEPSNFEPFSVWSCKLGCELEVGSGVFVKTVSAGQFAPVPSKPPFVKLVD
jgi:hypothetical protein